MVNKAVEVLLAAGWRGIAAALALVILYAFVRVYGPRLPKPTQAPPPPVGEVPAAEEPAQWGGNVGSGISPDDRPPG